MAADFKEINAGIPKPINEITGAIIGSAMRVSNALGVGFAEKVYENALKLYLEREGLRVEQQASILIEHDGTVLGKYVTDLLVEDQVIVELKAVVALQSMHKAQCINYLRATGKPICLLFNFGRKRLEFRRFANTRDRAREVFARGTADMP
jgi:GxxExxY protein